MLGDAQNKGIHRPAVAVVESLESAGVALQNAFHQDSIGRLFALGPGLDDCKQQNSVPFPFLSKYGETKRLDETRAAKLSRGTSYYVICRTGFGLSVFQFVCLAEKQQAEARPPKITRARRPPRRQLQSTR